MAIRIKECRQASGFTLQEVADMAGVSNATISHYEMGRRIPDIVTFKRLADIFGVSLNYLLGEDVPKGIPQRTKEETQAHDILQGLSPDQIQNVKSFIAGMKAATK